MKINRHNYEEYFILYWDNELDPSQKKMVENFIEGNPELADEFHLLGEIRYASDEKVVYDKKEFLLSELQSPIHKENYQEYLIRYTDNELDVEKRTEVEKFTASHPAAKKELDIFLKTRLQPDTEIIFPDKSILYREPSRVKILRLSWMRIAAAAVLLLISGFVLLRFLNSGSKNSDPGIAINDKAATGQEQLAPVTDPQKTDDSLIEKNPENNIGNTPASPRNEIQLAQTVTEKKRYQQNPQIEYLPEEKTGEHVYVKNEISTETAAIQPRQLTKQVMETEDVERKILILSDNSVTEKITPTYAVYTPPDESDDSGGFKELLRKATRVFERRTKIQATTEDNKLLVGAFTVSLK